METKKYSSYKQIEQDLEILKVEKTIYYQKTILNLEKTKQKILPSKNNIAMGLLAKVTSTPIGAIAKFILPIAVNWYLKRKRGN